MRLDDPAGRGYNLPVPVFIRLVVASAEPRTLRLPDLPRRGEVLELPDHIRVVVDAIERTPNDIVDAEVHATRTLWQPTDHAIDPPA